MDKLLRERVVTSLGYMPRHGITGSHGSSVLDC